MDRVFTYTGAVPQDTDILSSNKNALYGLGYLAQAVLGTGTSVIGLVGAQTAVPSLQITIGAGAIYSLQTVDATAYGDLGTDANTLVKQGLLKAAQTLTLTAPITSGYSQVYLVEAAYQDIDGGAAVLPYYNSSMPSAPYAGPANAGTSNYTVRQGVCTITLKAGTAATTGTQTTPSTDAGYVPLYTITLANGQTTITTAQIVTASGAPFVPYNLNNLPFLKAQTDTGTANALVVTEPSISALFVGMTLTIKKSAAANTGAATININGIGATSVVWADGTALAAGDWPASVTALVEYDGTQFNVLSVMGPSVFARVSAMTGRLLNVRVFNAAGTSTYTPTTGTNSVVVAVQAGGASGGGAVAVGASTVSCGAPGGAGSYALSRITSAFSGVTVTVGAGGAAVTGATGNNGGTSSFGALVSCPGGVGGQIGGPTTAPFSEGGIQSSVPTGGSLINASGSPGGVSFAPASGTGFAGPGGSSQYGGGGSAPAFNQTGVAATSPGAGGSGTVAVSSSGSLTSGAGATGSVLVYEYS